MAQPQNAAGRRAPFRADPRAYLICMAAGIAAIALVRTEAGLAAVFAATLAAAATLGHARTAASCLAAFAALQGIAWLGTQALIESPVNPFGLALSSMGSIGRRMLVPLAFAAALADAPTGSLLAALRALRLPKAAGIGLAVLLRFFPTLGKEYRTIRRSQKFRGVGLGVAHTIAHLPSTLECILVPLVIRTSKLSDELSASIAVRGVRFGGETVSYRPLGFSGRDAFAAAAYAAACLAAFMLSQPGGVLS